MEAVLTLICKRCNQQLMLQKVSCSVGNYATISIDELMKFAGPCCTQPDRTAKVEFRQTSTVVESER